MPEIANKFSKKPRRKYIRWGIISGNIILLLAVSIFILANRSASQTVRNSAITGAASAASSLSSPLDQVSSSQIALQAAQMTKLPELTAVRNQADTESATLSIIKSDTTVLSKPQIVETSLKSKKDIITYTTKPGDTISSLSATFHVTANSIRWSNGLSGDVIAANKAIKIPPADGVVYQVKATDTIDSLVSKYQSSKDLFISVNDAESGKLNVNEFIWIPGGQQPTPVLRFASYGGFAWGGSAPIYSDNGYDRGWCTWWAAYRRIQIGSPVPSNLGNAISWKYLAQRAGLGVGTKPAAGAVVWYSNIGGLGHVGFAEKVNPDGSVWVSDMNYFGHVSMDESSPSAGGWNRVSYHLISAADAGNYWYIY